MLTTFFIMGFGYFTAERSLERPLPMQRLAWIAFFGGLIGVVLAVGAILSGRASVLYTFYPPITGSVFYYLGLVLVVAASWVWCAIMIRGDAAMEARQSRTCCSARHVCHRSQRHPVALDDSGVTAELSVSGHSCGTWLVQYD